MLKTLVETNSLYELTWFEYTSSKYMENAFVRVLVSEDSIVDVAKTEAYGEEGV